MESSVQPVFLNVEYLFFLVARAVGGFFAYVFSISFLETARMVATVLVIVLIAYILYLLVRLYELKQEEEKEDDAKTLTPFYEHAAPASTGGATSALSAGGFAHNDTWTDIRAKLLSDNQSEWKLAIIEADIYMDKLLDERGFHGETTSDKLKQITPAALASINVAWEAHKVRNRIAHDGAAFTLTQPEARRILSYFEIVFRDLGVIE